MPDRIVGGIAQYERLGSFEPFLRQYLWKCLRSATLTRRWGIRSYLSMNLLAEASTKERARTAPVKPDKPLKLAQLRAAKRIWLNAGVLRNFACLMGVLLHFVAACFELCGLHSRD